MASDSAAVGIFAYFVMLQAVAMPVLTFSIAPSFVVSLGLTFAQSVSAQSYALQHSFVGMDFFGKDFDLYNSWDPTFGYVHYVDLPTAQQYNMINMTYVTDTGKARWGVDTTQVLDPNANLGRPSIRLHSKETFTHGLFVLDLAHLPASQCGSWPAFWTLGTGTWPSAGEIDIIEVINNVPNNLMSLHTSSSPNCTVSGVHQSGSLLSNDCAFANSYTGCAVSATQAGSSGSAFNAVGGGVYAMLWTSNGIQIWFWPRGDIPMSLRQGTKAQQPDINEFGTPAANFEGSCDFDAHFFDHQLIFDTDFCGSWAGPAWQADGCPMAGADQSWQSCNDYVAANPQAFTESYWEVNYLNVYQSTATSACATCAQSSTTQATILSIPTTSSVPAVATSSISTLSSNALGRSSTPVVPAIVPGVPTAQADPSPIRASSSTNSVWVDPSPFTTPAIKRSPDVINCNVNSQGHDLHETYYTCTFTEQIQAHVGPVMETSTRSTSLQAGSPLAMAVAFGGVDISQNTTIVGFEIASISVELLSTKKLPSAEINQATYTGAFFPDPMSLATTTLTALAVSSGSNTAAISETTLAGPGETILQTGASDASQGLPTAWLGISSLTAPEMISEPFSLPIPVASSTNTAIECNCFPADPNSNAPRPCTHDCLNEKDNAAVPASTPTSAAVPTTTDAPTLRVDPVDLVMGFGYDNTLTPVPTSVDPETALVYGPVSAPYRMSVPLVKPYTLPGQTTAEMPVSYETIRPEILATAGHWPASNITLANIPTEAAGSKTDGFVYSVAAVWVAAGFGIWLL